MEAGPFTQLCPFPPAPQLAVLSLPEQGAGLGSIGEGGLCGRGWYFRPVGGASPAEGLAHEHMLHRDWGSLRRRPPSIGSAPLWGWGVPGSTVPGVRPWRIEALGLRGC